MVEGDDDAAVVVVTGALDLAAGHLLTTLAAGAVERGATRLEVDLHAVTSFTDEGAAALRVCRQLGADLPAGVHYRTGPGAGRTALIAAYAGEGEDDEAGRNGIPGDDHGGR